MKKPVNIIIISGILVLIGIGISFYQSKMEDESIATDEQTIAAGGSMSVTKNLDPHESKNGVFSVQVFGFKEEDNINGQVLGPSGKTITPISVTKSPLQENFTISQLGNYTLQIQNSGHQELQIQGIIGYYPHGATVIDLVAVIILFIGLGGLAIGMVYLIKRRK